MLAGQKLFYYFTIFIFIFILILIFIFIPPQNFNYLHEPARRHIQSRSEEVSRFPSPIKMRLVLFSFNFLLFFLFIFLLFYFFSLTFSLFSPLVHFQIGRIVWIYFYFLFIFYLFFSNFSFQFDSLNYLDFDFLSSCLKS